MIDYYPTAHAVREATHVFSSDQVADGSVGVSLEGYTNAHHLLESIIGAYQRLCMQIGGKALDCAEMFSEDTQRWIDSGLHNMPDFSTTHSHWTPSSSERDLRPFLAPLRIPNGLRGGSFVLNFALTRARSEKTKHIVEEAAKEVNGAFSIPIVEAPVRTVGFSVGDGGVIFSELMASTRRKGPQTFGAFIISDFEARYEAKTLGAQIDKGPILAESLIMGEDIDPSEERAVWLQVHDRFHQLGSLPYAEHVDAKMNFSTAVLDEVKADGSAYLALRKIGGLWSGVAVRQLTDKMFRFPFSPYAFTAIDGAVGEVFLRDAINTGGLRSYASRGVELDMQRLDDCAGRLVEDILSIESDQTSQEDYVERSGQYLKSKGVSLPPERAMLKWEELLR